MAIAPIITRFSTNSGSTADRLTNDTTPTLTITAEAGSMVSVYRDGALVGTAAVGSPGVFEFTSPALADGSYQFSATARDAQGSTSAVSANFGIQIDSTPPTAAITGFDFNSGSTEDHLTIDRDPMLTIAAEAGSTVSVYRDGALVGTATESSPGTFSFTSSVLAEGSYQFSVTARDAADNTSAPSASFGIEIDTTRPGLPIINGFSDNTGSISDHVTSDTTPTLSIAAEAGATVTVYHGAMLLGTATESSPGMFSFTTGTLLDGIYEFTAQVTDRAGYTSLYGPSDPIRIQIDTGAPTGDPGIRVETARVARILCPRSRRFEMAASSSHGRRFPRRITSIGPRSRNVTTRSATPSVTSSRSRTIMRTSLSYRMADS